MKFSVFLRRTLLVAILLLAAAGLATWWLLHVTILAPKVPAKDALPALPADFSLADLRLPAQADLPDLELATLANGEHRALLFCCDPNAFTDLVAMRWVSEIGAMGEIPDVPRIGIMSAPAIPQILRGPPIEMLRSTASEFPFALRLDFGRTIGNAFQLPSGAPAVILLGPGGAIDRLSGDVDAAKVARIRAFSGLPPALPSPRAPEWRSKVALPTLRARTPVAIAFLSRRVTESETPNYEKMPLMLLIQGMKPPEEPSLRLVTFFAGSVPKPGDAQVGEIVIAGELDGFEDRPWLRVADDTALRGAFGVASDEVALIAIDADGRLRVDVRGKAPMWRLGAVADLLGLPPPFSPSSQ